MIVGGEVVEEAAEEGMIPGLDIMCGYVFIESGLPGYAFISRHDKGFVDGVRNTEGVPRIDLYCVLERSGSAGKF